MNQNLRCEFTGKFKNTCYHCSPVNWAKTVLRNHRQYSTRFKQAVPRITPQDLASLRGVSSHCYLCGEKLQWDAEDRNLLPHLDHNHKTGEVRGYTHGYCNIIAGNLSRLYEHAGRGNRGITFNLIRVIFENWRPD